MKKEYNIFDYLMWRDDTKLDKISEVDTLVFSKISYFPLIYLMKTNEELTLKELGKKAIEFKDKFYGKRPYRLLNNIKKSNRYKNLKIKNLVNINNPKEEINFQAVTIELNEETCFVSFRGTTSDLVDWKDTFNLMYKETITQKEAVKYIDSLNYKKIYVGGHSKGGNLAIYGSIYSKNKENIIKIFNLDGPGFETLTKEYLEMKGKIISYIPRDSLAGRLMKSEHETITIKSMYEGYRQHNLFNWCMIKEKYVKDTLSEESHKYKKIFDTWLEQTTKEEREVFVTDLFKSIFKTGAKNKEDIDIKDLTVLLKEYKNIKEESKKLAFLILNIVYQNKKTSIIEKIKNIENPFKAGKE